MVLGENDVFNIYATNNDMVETDRVILLTWPNTSTEKDSKVVHARLIFWVEGANAAWVKTPMHSKSYVAAAGLAHGLVPFEHVLPA